MLSVIPDLLGAFWDSILDTIDALAKVPLRGWVTVIGLVTLVNCAAIFNLWTGIGGLL